MKFNNSSLDLNAKFENLSRFQKNHKKSIKIAAVVLTIIVALVFFVVKGEIQKKQEQLQLAEQIQSSQEAKSEKNQYAKEYQEKSKSGKDTKGELVADISGQVKKPGVYKLKPGDRINDLIELAGGLTEDANVDNVNRASKVQDGDKVNIPNKSESNTNIQDLSNGYGESKSTVKTDEKINLNSADEYALKSIPGVGPAMAKKILDYRKTNGKFNSVEDIKNISGVGDKTFAKMQDYIVV